MWNIELGYLGLFITCFLAATILPIASELFLGSMLLAGYDPIIVLIVATAGNTLGSWLNYGIGYIGNPKWLKKLRVSEAQIIKWEQSINKYGVGLALFSWLPVIGDVIGVALGFFKVSIFWSFLFMAIGKFCRYLCLVIFYLYVK